MLIIRETGELVRGGDDGIYGNFVLSVQVFFKKKKPINFFKVKRKHLAIVFSEEFENAEHIIGIMYIYPMIMHLWPTARKLNVSGLIFVNYYFVFLYLLESALKVSFKIEMYPI